MSRRPVNPARRLGGPGAFGGLFHPKTRVSPLISTILVFLGGVLVIGYFFSGSGSRVKSFSKFQGDFTCTLEVHKAIPLLKTTYGDSMHKVLHVGPESCSVVSKLKEEEDTEAWGVEPYDTEDADSNCKKLVRRGLVRVADIKFPLPYRAKSFSLVIVSDAVDYLSPKYLNKTLPELARVSSDGLVIFTGSPTQSKAKVIEAAKIKRTAKMRSSAWWARFFVSTSLEENEAAIKKFDQVAAKNSYTPSCQIFHLKSYQ